MKMIGKGEGRREGKEGGKKGEMEEKDPIMVVCV
jgi:hypothetical protein